MRNVRVAASGRSRTTALESSSIGIVKITYLLASLFFFLIQVIKYDSKAPPCVCTCYVCMFPRMALNSRTHVVLVSQLPE